MNMEKAQTEVPFCSFFRKESALSYLCGTLPSKSKIVLAYQRFLVAVCKNAYATESGKRKDL